MTRRLILMRHAKSSWDHPTLTDHDRPLNPRGERGAQGLGAWLRAGGYLPDELLCSPARRTRQTAELLELDVGLTLVDRLYHAGPDQMMDVLRHATGRTVLMLGHNPGIAEFAWDLAAERPDHPRFADYPTGATLIADLPISTWADTEGRSAEVLAFVTPHDIMP